ncbi:hypothetical protein EHW66_16875 [Erwinia psidii]|uniref:hypothetical protein n=1 Tax=Erwinia psidii TaxID=69224 RepID=UPI00226B2D55|nr:hypothetical protein [Erwinia psidii]MCX8966590.1 hypothetical protein [Erwinia psidii]
MQLLSQESWLSAIHFKKSLRYVVKHGVIMPGAFAVTLTLAVGPDRIYDYLTDLDTAILYESIEKSLRNAIAYDTPSNQATINLKSVKDRNQYLDKTPNSDNVIFGKDKDSEPVDFSPELHSQTLTTAANRQLRLNLLLNISSTPALPRNALNNVLVGFASHRNSLKPLVKDVVAVFWMLCVSCSVAIDTVFQNRREHKSK